jgi:opine dehydrogenase
VWREQLDFEHRYIVKDVAIGLVLWSSLGRAVSVPTPLTDALIDLASGITGVDYRSRGRTLERLGLASHDADSLRETLQ